jgi:uncharacterized protein YjiS (DUF1127 family)
MSSQSLTTRSLADAATPAPDNGWMRAAPVRRHEKPRVAGLWAMIVAAYRRHRSRAALARLDGYILKDIGVSLSEAEHEANKPFWRE